MSWSWCMGFSLFQWPWLWSTDDWDGLDMLCIRMWINSCLSPSSCSLVLPPETGLVHHIHPPLSEVGLTHQTQHSCTPPHQIGLAPQQSQHKQYPQMNFPSSQLIELHSTLLPLDLLWPWTNICHWRREVPNSVFTLPLSIIFKHASLWP